MTLKPDRARLADRESGSIAVQDEPSWAHVSGWAQLSGSRQTVSCVLPCENQAHILVKLLPILSDTLTECGYPWELIAVDAGSIDETAAVLDAWTELPGFRCLRPAPQQGNGLADGLLAARGDAVILFDAEVRHSPELIPRMILLWEADALLVHARRDPALGHSVLVHWDEAETARRLARPDFSLPAQCLELGLLDRRLVDTLLQER